MIAQLRKLGHEVVPVADGEEAWGSYKQVHPELVITDWKMPGLSGLELCRRIRNEKRGQYTYVIILTAMDRDEGFVEGMEAGADDFMTKPCDFAELVVRLRVAQRIVALQTHVASLQGLLPICPDCKKIKDEQNEWQPVETYIGGRSEATFSHGICPECMESIIKPQMMEMKQRIRLEGAEHSESG
jgi:DNA-binding response OmpR family regulator